MNVVDLHPDDLLDKDAHGELSVAERARLEAHLERCETCRFEREVRADFASELGDEEEISSQRLLSLMEGMPRAAPAPKQEPALEEDAPAPPARISTRPTRTRRALRVALLVAAALLVGSAATASGMSGGVWTSVASVLHLADTEPTPLAVPVAAPRVIVPVAARVEAPVVTPVAAVAPEEEETKPAPIAAVSVSAPVESAATLFDSANQARRAGDYGRAIALHRRLESSYPQSRETHVSYATVGRLLLDRGDAAGALASFRSYESRGPGPMDEAVLVGTATALERLGRDGEARAVWSRLLTSFPDTPYREHARTRLEGR